MLMQRVLNVFSQNSNLPLSVERSKPKPVINGKCFLTTCVKCRFLAWTCCGDGAAVPSKKHRCSLHNRVAAE